MVCWQNAQVFILTLAHSHTGPSATLGWPKINFLNKLSPEAGHHHLVGKIIDFPNELHDCSQEIHSQSFFGKMLQFSNELYNADKLIHLQQFVGLKSISPTKFLPMLATTTSLAKIINFPNKLYKCPEKFTATLLLAKY